VITRKLAEISLGSFAGVDDEEKRQLLDVFWAWLDNDGSIPKAAAAVFCHPNTVRNRLRRIEEHTGRSLNVSRELAELHYNVFQASPGATQSSETGGVAPVLAAAGGDPSGTSVAR
jgi:hypothetical protein